MRKFYLIFKDNFFYLLLGLMVFIPLYPKFPLFGVSGTYVSIRFEDILIGFLSLLWVFFNHKKLKLLWSIGIYRLFVIFWLIGFLSFVSALFLTFTISPSLGLLHWIRRIEYMFIFIIAATTFKEAWQLKMLLKAGLLTSILIIFYGFGQQYLNFPVISTTNREFSKGLILYLTPEARVNSTFAGHYDLAAYLNIFLVVLGSLLFFYKKLPSRVLIILSGVAGLLLLGMTAARVSYVATLIGLTVTFWLNRRYWLIVALIASSIAVVGLVPDLRHRFVATLTVNLLGGGGPKYTPPDNVPLTPQFLSESSRAALLREATLSGENIATVASDIAPGEPINSTELGVYRSFGIRLNVEWPRAINAFLRNPILGTGYSSISIATDNDILRSLGEVGILGTAALSAILVVILARMLKFARSTKGLEHYFIVGVFCATFGILVTSLMIDILEASKIAILFWFLLGVSWAVMDNAKD